MIEMRYNRKFDAVVTYVRKTLWFRWNHDYKNKDYHIFHFISPKTWTSRGSAIRKTGWQQGI